MDIEETMQAKIRARQQEFGVQYISMLESGAPPRDLEACVISTVADMAKIRDADAKLKARQQQFGMEFITLMEKGAPKQKLQECVNKTMADIAKLKGAVGADTPINARAMESAPAVAAPRSASHSPASRRRPGVMQSASAGASSRSASHSHSPASRRKPGVMQSMPALSSPLANGYDRSPASLKQSVNATASAAAASVASASVALSEDADDIDDDASSSSSSSSGSSSGTSTSASIISDDAPPSLTEHGKRVIVRHKEHKISKSAGRRKPNDGFKAGDEENPFADANPYQWRLNEYQFSGKARYESKGEEERIQGKSIAEGIDHFKENPDDYVAMLYQTSMLKEKWPPEECEYIYVHRKGTKMYQPQGISEDGWMTVFLQEYEALPSFENDILPFKYRDAYTDDMTYKGHKLHSDSNPPIMPGRGMGICDSPNIKIIGDVDPSDIHQGQIGDCWLLSGISSLAEFDGAIKHLFRKTPGLAEMPREKPNTYVVTYWDLETWTEIDIEIDERLAVAANGGLLAAKPSADGELWVCYLEKAFAIHAGGWDKIVGGQCSHAWAVMTGCKHQYIITETSPGSRRWHCALRYNNSEQKWGEHANSPHDCDGKYYKAFWPEVGGGGTREDISEEELFAKMCAWDDTNYIMGAGTTGSSDENTTGGMVDNHAYSVIECLNDIAGTPVDLIKVRNPWGKGEIEEGEFDDDGPGWDEWPQVKKAVNPVVADDGIFYMTPDEFFRRFGTIFLSASDMTAFLED